MISRGSSTLSGHNGSGVAAPTSTKSAKLMKIFPVRNRWLCLSVYLVAIFLTTCTYYGWQHMQWILVMSGKFEDFCDDSDVRPPDAERDEYLCEEQANAIDIAYTIASSCEFSGALVAGLLFDYVGPVPTAVVGELIHFISWPFILLSPTSTGVYIGFALLGLSVNVVAIPAMILMCRFPTYPLLMESLNLAAQTLTAFTMPAIYIIMKNNPTWTFNSIMGVYLSIAAVVALAYIFLLPFRRDQIEIVQALQAKRPHYHRLTYYLTRPEFIAFVMWYTLMIMQASMFNTKLDTVASKEVSNYVGWIFWLQAPIGVAFGFVNEKFRSLTLCWILLIMTMLAYLLTIINTVLKDNYDGTDWSASDEILYYIGATSYVVSNAYIYTIKFTWITEMFPGNYFGTLTGTIGLSAGVVQTVNTAFVSYSAMSMLITYMCLGLIEIGLLVFVHIATRKKGICYTEPAWFSGSSSHSIDGMKKGSVSSSSHNKAAEGLSYSYSYEP